ncbi:MAG: HlyD family efflux transporter periplasmic adaptor subunit [Chloroflexota bacterium]
MLKNLKNRKRALWAGLILLALAAAGGYAYYQYVYLPAQTVSDSSELQTATVRAGDLVIYASGSGTLVASNEVDLGFRTGGQVTQVSVEIGDTVKAGDILAQVDDTSARIALTQAKRALAELTSVKAIATAQEAVATAQSDLADAHEHLEYLISPTVLHWEEEVAKAEQAVKDAQAAVDANPTDPVAQQNLADAQAYLKRAQANLATAWDTYQEEYLPNNFTVRTVDPTTRHVVKYVAAPTEADILEARAAYAAAQAALQEAIWYYNALTGGEVPPDATGSNLGTLEQARLDVASAQYSLDGTRITAPIDGTVMSVDISVGDTAGTSAVITVADLTHPTLEIFLDASDWANVKVGYKAEVTFDMLPDTIYTGKVVQVDPGLYTESNSSVVRALVKLDTVEESFNVPLGASASVDVIGGEARNAVLVPIEALHQAGEQYTVFVVENGELKLRVVEIGIQDLLYAEVKSGLEAGDVVSTGITETK